MSSLSKSILGIALYPRSAEKEVKQALRNRNQRFLEYVTAFTTPDSNLMGFYVFVYLEDHEDIFVKETYNVIKALHENGITPVFMRIMTKEGFTRHEWIVSPYEQELHAQSLDMNAPYAFVFIQLAFITRAWLRLIQKEISEYAQQRNDIIPMKKWNNYLTSVLFIVPDTVEYRKVVSTHLHQLIMRIIEASEGVKLERPQSHVPEVLYQDIVSTIMSGLIHSTTQGIALIHDTYVAFSVHLDGENVVLREIHEDQE